MWAHSAMTPYTSLSALIVPKRQAPRAHVTCRTDMVYPSQGITRDPPCAETLVHARACLVGASCDSA